MINKKFVFVLLAVLGVIVLFNYQDFGEGASTGFVVLKDNAVRLGNEIQRIVGVENVFLLPEKENNKSPVFDEKKEIDDENMKNPKTDGKNSGGGSVSWQNTVPQAVLQSEPNSPPVILNFSPNGNREISAGEIISFFVQADDTDNAELVVEWFVDSVFVGIGDSFEFDSKIFFGENFEVKVVVSDGKNSVSKEWKITIIHKQSGINPVEKIHPTLLLQNASPQISGEKKVRVLVSVSGEKEFSNIKEIINENNGFVQDYFKTGDVIVADIDTSALMNIAGNGGVKSIWPDERVFAFLDSSVSQIGAPVLWSNGFKGEGVKVAVVDTGIDKTHSMLLGKVLLEKNFSSSPSITDNFGHGTHVAGIVAGTTDSNGLFNGVAPQAVLFNAKALNDEGNGSMSGIIAAINWAVDPDNNPLTDDGAKIINLSLGSPTPYNPLDPVHNVISEAVSNGVLIVVSSGNCGEVSPSIDCQGYIGVTTPGNSPNALTVGAVDDFNNWASFSSGQEILGVGIKPDITAPGVSIVSSIPQNFFEEKSGTSMAAPHAAGAAALLLSAKESLSPLELKKLLELNAIDLGLNGKDARFGSGVLNLGDLIEPKLVLSEENFFGFIDENQVFEKSVLVSNAGLEDLQVFGVTATPGIVFSLENNFLDTAQSANLDFSVSGAGAGVGTFLGQIDLNTSAGVKTVFVEVEVSASTNPVIRSVNIPKTVFRGEQTDIVVQAVDDSRVDSVNVLITDSFGVTTDLPLVLSGDGLWRFLQYQFPIDPSLAGRFDVNILAVDDSLNETVFETSFDLVNALVFFPQEFVENQDSNIGFTYKNTLNTSIEATAVAEVFDETGFLVEELSQSKDVPSNNVADFNLLWSPQVFGNYSLKLNFFEGTNQIEELDKNISVLVPDALEITGFSLGSNPITKGGTQTYSVSVENFSEQDLNALIEINVLQGDFVVEVFTIENAIVPKGVNRVFDVQKEVLLLGENYYVTTKLHYGNRVEDGLSENFVVVTPANGSIESVILPQEIFIDQNHVVQVNFNNSGGVPLNVVLEGEIRDGNNLVGSIDFNAAVIPAFESFIFEAVHGFNGLSGEYLLRITADYEGNTVQKDVNFFVVDNKKPIIGGLEFENEIEKNSPFIVRFNVGEDSEIGSAVLNVNGVESDLAELSFFGSTHLFSGTFADTLVVGLKDFFVEVCDEFGNCSSTLVQSFSIVDCVGEKLLVVSDEDYFSQLLESEYCVSNWRKSENGVPLIGYLQLFDAVVWGEGNSVSNIDGNEAVLLENFVSSGGKLLLEGAEIGFKHRSDEFMQSVARSILAEDLIFSDSNSVLSYSNKVFVSREHPVTTGFSEFDVNVVVSPFPDAVSPVNGGISLADWNGSQSAMVLFNDYNASKAKTVFFSFNFNALVEPVKSLLLGNTVKWLLGESGIDLSVESINVPAYIVEQSATPIEIVLENTVETEVAVFVDDELYGTVPVSNNLVEMNVDFSFGNHVVKAVINPSFSTKENYYFNNVLEKEVWVATTEPDVLVKGFSYSSQEPLAGETLQIDANIVNVGGTTANVDVVFFVDENMVGTQSVLVPFGGNAIASTFWTAELGVYELRIVANPLELDSNSLNNEFVGKLFVCSGPSVLVVSDDDAESYSGSNPNSSQAFEEILEGNGYCFVVWKESEKGVPSIDYLNQFDALIWSAGDYWNTVLDENDMELLEGFSGNVLFEGSDMGFDNTDSGFLEKKLFASFDKDLVLEESNSSLILNNHRLLNGITSIALDIALSPFPDSIIPVNGESIANWSNAESAIIVSNVFGSKTAFIGFSVDAIIDSVARERLILNLVEWLTEENLAPQIVSGNTNSPVSEGEVFVVDVNAFDPNFDVLVYSIDSNLFDANENVFSWVTDFSSAGEHVFTVTVSDGNMFDSVDVNVEIINVNRAPQIDSFTPLYNPVVFEGQNQEFEVVVFDPDFDDLNVSWFVDNEFVASGESFTFFAEPDSAGTHDVNVVVSDRQTSVSREWVLVVKEFAAPTAPTNLTLISASPEKVELAWEDNSDNETGFTVERVYLHGLPQIARSDFEFFHLPVDTNFFVNVVPRGSFTVGEKFSYIVRVHNPAGESYSNKIIVEIPS